MNEALEALGNLLEEENDALETIKENYPWYSREVTDQEARIEIMNEIVTFLKNECGHNEETVGSSDGLVRCLSCGKVFLIMEEV